MYQTRIKVPYEYVKKISNSSTFWCQKTCINPPKKMLERERGWGEFPRNLYYFGMVLQSVFMSGNLIGLMKWLVLKIGQNCQELCVTCRGQQKPIALKIKVSVETHWKPPHGEFCEKIFQYSFLPSVSILQFQSQRTII